MIGLTRLLGIFSRIEIRASAVDEEAWLRGAPERVADLYAADLCPGEPRLYQPLALASGPVDQVVLVGFKGDELYSCLELQRYQGPGGAHPVVVAYRNDGGADIYTPTGREVDPSFYAIGEQAAGFYQSAIEQGFEQGFEQHTGDGEARVRAWLDFVDHRGRRLRFILEDARGAQSGMLAPIGDSFHAPGYFPLFFATDMGFAARTSARVEVSVDDAPRKPATLPLPVGNEPVFLARYSSDFVSCLVLPAFEGELASSSTREDGLEVVEHQGFPEIVSLRKPCGSHIATLRLAPGLPALACLRPELRVQGRFSLSIDETTGIVAGSWEARRQGEEVHLQLRPEEGYQPTPGKPWVKSYLWRARLRPLGEGTMSMRSGWERT